MAGEYIAVVMCDIERTDKSRLQCGRQHRLTMLPLFSHPPGISGGFFKQLSLIFLMVYFFEVFQLAFNATLYRPASHLITLPKLTSAKQ